MKLLSQPAAFVAIMLSLSCNEPAPQTTASSKQDVPEALQNKSSVSDVILKREYRGNLLIDEIYTSMIEKNADLNQLESQIQAYSESKDDSLGVYNSYNSKSLNYYNGGKAAVSEISDTLLKKQLMAILEKSEKNYKSKTGKLTALIKNIKKHELSLNDYHTVLKVAVTLPVMEKYQQTELAPVTKAIVNLEQKAAGVEKKTKSLAEKKIQ